MTPNLRGRLLLFGNRRKLLFVLQVLKILYHVRDKMKSTLRGRPHNSFMGTFKEIMEIVIITNNKLNNSFQNIYCFQAVVWIQRNIISNQLIMFSRYERAKLGMFLGYLSPYYVIYALILCCYTRTLKTKQLLFKMS